MPQDIQPISPYPEGVQVTLPDLETHVTFDIQAERPMDDDQFFDFCASNPELRLSAVRCGGIIIMPPAGFETGYRNNEICRQLGNWVRADARGVALDSNTQYILPNGAARSPDASWVKKHRLAMFTREQKKKFLPLSPDFVIELVSDRLLQVKAKIA